MDPGVGLGGGKGTLYLEQLNGLETQDSSLSKRSLSNWEKYLTVACVGPINRLKGDELKRVW